MDMKKDWDVETDPWLCSMDQCYEMMCPFPQNSLKLCYILGVLHLDGLVQDCSNSSALALELLQSCTKPLIYFVMMKTNSGYLDLKLR